MRLNSTNSILSTENPRAYEKEEHVKVEDITTHLLANVAKIGEATKSPTMKAEDSTPS